MSIIKDVTIINETRLRLDIDAKAGDEIDLTLLNKVDTSIIIDKINKAKDEEYEKKLKEFEKRVKAEHESQLLNKTNELNLEITKLKSEIDSTVSKTESKLKLEHEKELNQLKQNLIQEKSRIETLKENLKRDIESAVKEKEAELNQRIHQMELSIKDKENEIKTIKESSAIEKELKVKEKEIELKGKINELETEVSNLRFQRSSLDVKKLGEKLEGWCDSEYASYAVNGFETCTWEKDNKSIKDDDEAKGTKADYVFKVYATKERKEEDLLTSVVLEMKSENPNTKTKQNNSKFYDKLDKDRNKKNAEYALLVSELEWDQENDVPIRRIQEYDKMYLVRPQYFINLLSIIASLALKYKEILIESNKEALKFKDAQEILDDFNKMKEDILDRQIRFLSREIETISKKADDIKKLSEDIKASTEKITNTYINQIINKIEGFKIRKINQKIEDVELIATVKTP